MGRTNHYRCSAGLVLDALGHRLGSATLGEANGATRAELREQIKTEGLADVSVEDDAVAALRTSGVGAGGSLLVHIDPFSLSPELWAQLAPALDSVCARGANAVLVVYRYTRNARAVWPSAPKGAIGPVAQTRGGPHEVAAYASEGIASAVRDACVGLGWQRVPS